MRTKHNVEDVFKKSGVPTITFVEPVDFTKLVVSLRAKGRSVVVEGPSGIGKTTAVLKALSKARVDGSFTKLSARKPNDVRQIQELFEEDVVGNYLIDDFHKLSAGIQSAIANQIKVIADEERESVNIVVIGINDSGRSLVKFADDVANRLDFFRLEVNPDHKIAELISKGEAALRISIDTKEEIVRECQGSFYLAQMLCYEICVKTGITETVPEAKSIDISFEQVKESVWKDLNQRFLDRCQAFCRGPKFRPSGRAPYLHILQWLATSKEWSINLKERLRAETNMKGSVGQVIDKKFMRRHIDANKQIDEVLHLDDDSSRLTVEDPQFILYIRNIAWNEFSQSLGFRNIAFDRRYDFAISFSGTSREIARRIFECLMEHEFEVFYDLHEQDRILSEDVEEYLEPIYRSEAKFVICLIDSDYPKRVWTRFEAGIFKDRFSDGEVIPVLVGDTDLGAFSNIEKIGHFRIGLDSVDQDVVNLVSLCCKKMEPA